METWAWLAAYVVGFALLQVYLYFYFVRGRSTGTDSSAERSTHGIPESTGTSIERPESATDDDAVACANCGTYNENHQMFSFCKECGDRLQ